MRKLLIVLISIILTTFATASAEETKYYSRLIPDFNKSDEYEINTDEKAAVDFIKSQSWKITGHKGKVDEYTLEKLMVDIGSKDDYRYIWSLQKVKAGKYFGKVITVYAFSVINHPLQWRDKYAKRYGAAIYVMMCEGKVVGGYSFPNITGLTGGYYSLYGETWGKVNELYLNKKTGNWEKKYNNVD